MTRWGNSWTKNNQSTPLWSIQLTFIIGAGLIVLAFKQGVIWSNTSPCMCSDPLLLFLATRTFSIIDFTLIQFVHEYSALFIIKVKCSIGFEIWLVVLKRGWNKRLLVKADFIFKYLWIFSHFFISKFFFSQLFGFFSL